MSLSLFFVGRTPESAVFHTKTKKLFSDQAEKKVSQIDGLMGIIYVIGDYLCNRGLSL